MTHALIIGGGIAGAVTAMALGKVGITSTVYEAYPTGADDVGAFLAIMNNGLNALRAVDADQLVTDNSFAAVTAEMFSGTGKHLGTQLIGTGARTLRRATLYRVLHDELARRGGKLEHGKRLVGAETTPSGGVLARFEDGTETRGDLLVGADGLHSATRTILDPNSPSPRYAGLNMVYGYTETPAPQATPDSYHMTFGKRAFFGYTTAPDGHTWWFCRLPAPELGKSEIAATTATQWRERALAYFTGDNTPSMEIIRATGADIVGSNVYDVPSTPNWFQGPMVLVGDAAHAASPAAGQGASMALEDSVILAQCLRDLPDTERAFSAYVRLRRERVERLVAASNKQGGATSIGPIRRAIRDLVLPIVLKRRPSDRAWLYDHHIDWDAKITV